MQKNKTIALVANTTWNIFNFRQNIIRKLLDKGHKVLVIAPIDEYIEYKEKYPEVVHVGLRTLRRNSINPFQDILLLLELKRKYSKLKPDLIIHYTHKPNIFGTLASHWAGIESIAIVTGLGYSFIHKGFIHSITSRLYRLSSKYNKKIIFENQDDKELFIRQGLTTAENSVAVKGCGVDLHLFSPQSNATPNKQMTFTFIGRLLSDKGIREFAFAAKKIKKDYPNTKFVVIGDFDEKNPSTIDREELLYWIHHKIIDYKGFVRNVQPFISASDCVVLPSYREGLPRIVIEAMAMAKPIITTDTPGCRETVDQGITGFLVKSRSGENLVTGIQKFLELPADKRTAMGIAGRKKAEKEFDDLKIANEIYEIVLQAS